MLARQESTKVHKKPKGMITLPHHLRASHPIKLNANVQYMHLLFSMPIELVSKVDTTKITV